MAVKASKKKFRLEIKKKLNQQKPFSLVKKSNKIIKRVFQLPQTKSAQNIMCYVAQPTEVKTDDLIGTLLKQDKNLTVPVINNKQIEPAIIKNTSELKPSKYQILQPKNPKIFEGKIDLNIMPALAVDQKGNRLGRGYGCYDRFLEQDQPKFNLCLVFGFQVLTHLPTQAHDQTVDGFITQLQTQVFKTQPAK